MFRVTLPFVHFEGGLPHIALKPLDLKGDEPTDVYDHGGLWAGCFRRLARCGRLPARTVVPVLLPGGPARAAADDIVRELTATGIQVADFDDVVRVRQLAQI